GLPLSTTPSQSLSSPSQISADWFTFGRHAIAPLVQCVVPAAQTPKRPVGQAAPPPGSPLSTTPSQSLSLPSQTSGVGTISFWQGPHWPFTQVCVPSLHGSTLRVADGPP